MKTYNNDGLVEGVRGARSPGSRGTGGVRACGAADESIRSTPRRHYRRPETQPSIDPSHETRAKGNICFK